MTGEMISITSQGVDQDGEVWEYHAELAKRLGAELCRFDKYQGPYIACLNGVRLWLIDSDGLVQVYNERTHMIERPIPYDHDLIELAAKNLL